ASTILLAQQYPNTRFTGSDYHDQSIEIARKRAADAGVADRISFEVASAADFSGTGYDLAATFDCLHDMGDPLAAARHIRQALKPDGTWLVVEPYAADEGAGNLNPVGPPSGRLPSTPGSLPSGAPPRPRSTSSTRCARRFAPGRPGALRRAPGGPVHGRHDERSRAGGARRRDQ